jgi:hypothetical protein
MPTKLFWVAPLKWAIFFTMPKFKKMKKYGLNLKNASQRDRQYLLSKNDKIEFIHHLPELIKNNISEYDIYFSTFTFKNLKVMISYDVYRAYYNHMHLKFTRYIVTNKAHRKKLKPFMIFIPEKSTSKDLKNYYSLHHFHGFIAIPKHLSKNFYRKCVAYKVIDHYPFLSKIHLELKKDIVAPYSRSFSSPKLSICSYRIYKIHEPEEMYATAFYSGKQFQKSIFDCEHVIITPDYTRASV